MELWPASITAGNVRFWQVILRFIPAILGAYALDGLLAPVQGMIGKMLDMLPDVFAAAVIGFAGWRVAKVLRGLVVNLLAVSGANEANQKAGRLLSAPWQWPWRCRSDCATARPRASSWNTG